MSVYLRRSGDFRIAKALISRSESAENGKRSLWAMDITYIPMAKGFVYLAVVLDRFSRRVLSWRLSIAMEASFCVGALEEALAWHGKPEIRNTDQGSQFAAAAFTGVLAGNGIAIGMDGKGAWRDKSERLSRTINIRSRLRRAALADGEIRGSLSARLRKRGGRPSLD